MGTASHTARFTRALAQIWSVVVLALAGLAAMSAANDAASRVPDWLHDTLFVGTLLFLIESVVCIAVHELGHFAAARIVGWKVYKIAVGPFAYRVADRRFVDVKNYVLSGFVSAEPPPFERRERLNRAIYFSGGCVANFILTLATLPFLSALRGYPPNPLLAALGALSMISLISGVANLFPLGGFRNFRSDGLRLAELLIHVFRPPGVHPSNKESRKAKRRPV